MIIGSVVAFCHSFVAVTIMVVLETVIEVSSLALVTFTCVVAIGAFVHGRNCYRFCC